MSMTSMQSTLLKAAGLLLALSTGVAAQDYPSKPVRLIVPFPPGGSNDVVGRVIATQLSGRLGKQVIVDNRGGAGAVVGTELVANAPKDGYTLLVMSITNAINPWLYKLPYDPIKAFAPIAILASGTNVLVVNPELPVKSVKELVALAKEKPGQLQYASAGIGTFPHLSGELFKLAAGVDMLHVPFRGGGPALIDVVGGHTKVMFSNLLTAMPHIRAGKLRALGVGAAKRNAALPDVPTIAEAGVPGYEAANWWGILAPAGTPQAIIEKLHKELMAVQAMPEVQKHFESEGASVVQMSPAEFGKFVEAETARWGRVVKAAGIKAE
jgi:tripartite-type tricarboxylate transporter receptor subunit TctC